MTRKSLSNAALPESVQHLVHSLGARLRRARIARGLTRDELAERMFVAPRTLSRLEQGDPAVSLGILVSALYIIGRESDLEQLVSLESDRLSAKLSHDTLPKRVRRAKSSKTGELDF